MELFYSFILLIWVDKVLTKGVSIPLDTTLPACNETCSLEKCPKPEYCKGELIKDNCGCCSVCSTDNSTHLYNNYRRKKGKHALIIYINNLYLIFLQGSCHRY